ncbi:hypothetical protein D3C81_1898810 [compost metagenome]
MQRSSQLRELGKSLLPLLQHRKPLGNRCCIGKHPLKRSVLITRTVVQAGADFRNNELFKQIVVREGIIFLKITLDPALFTVNLLHIAPFPDVDIPSGQESVVFLKL